MTVFSNAMLLFAITWIPYSLQQSTVAPGASSVFPAVSTAAPGATTGAPEPNCDNRRLTNTQRSLLLNLHNNYRSSLAKGQTEVNHNWGIAPPAALMYRMLYDCNAESYAQQAVSTCRKTRLPLDTIGSHRQNIHVLNTVQTTPEGAMQNALATWWGQLASYGIRSSMMFYPSEFNRGASNVLSWSKMAWWDNLRVGCATQNCGTYYVTSCMYNPGGNRLNTYVYPVGAVCSQCNSVDCIRSGLCRW
ncbi:SCP-like protein [Oesophagostomum dentatum]|uniref:SCP-like protein n=1 Tax=Oesophagostomum dentatum TaxID=61180 RepID=A0A0B1T9L4_OESDE|nr:SCP-like protein [Oesophagostomum dentatum]